MPGTAAFGLFLTAAVILAITPGPGIFYVLTRRSAAAGARGLRIGAGTAVGGLGHVLAAGLGFRQCWRTSAFAFECGQIPGRGIS